MRLVSIYRSVSSIFLNTAIIFIVINILFYIVNKQKSNNNNNNLEFYLNLVDTNIYQSKNINFRYTHEKIVAVVSDFANHSNNCEFEYFPIIENIHKPFTSKYLNIIKGEDGLNYRKSWNNKENDKLKTIYCFGGSTTFGSFVEDNDTWPSQLSQLINKNDSASVIVKNYGQNGYSVTQETNLFITLLKLGHRPSLVIFLDGINTGPIYDYSEQSKYIAYKVNNTNNIKVSEIISVLPIVEYFNKSKNKITLENRNEDEVIYPFDFDEKYNHYIIERFIQNAKLRLSIAKLYNIEILQFLQPNTFLNYNYSYFPAQSKKEREILSNNNSFIRSNYKELYQAVMRSNTGYVDISFLFTTYNKPALIDLIHYSPEFNQFLAENILTHINLSKLKPSNSILNTIATGTDF